MDDDWGTWVLEELANERPIVDVINGLEEKGVLSDQIGHLIATAKTKMESDPNYVKRFKFMPGKGSETGFFRARSQKEVHYAGVSDDEEGFLKLGADDDRSGGKDGTYGTDNSTPEGPLEISEDLANVLPVDPKGTGTIGPGGLRSDPDHRDTDFVGVPDEDDAAVPIELPPSFSVVEEKGFLRRHWGNFAALGAGAATAGVLALATFVPIDGGVVGSFYDSLTDGRPELVVPAAKDARNPSFTPLGTKSKTLVDRTIEPTIDDDTLERARALGFELSGVIVLEEMQYTPAKLLKLDLDKGVVYIHVDTADGSSISTYAQIFASGDVQVFDELDDTAQKGRLKSEYSNTKLRELLGDRLSANAAWRKIIIEHNADKLVNVPRGKDGNILFGQTQPGNFVLLPGTVLEVPFSLDGGVMLDDIPTNSLDDIIDREVDTSNLPSFGMIVDDYMTLLALSAGNTREANIAGIYANTLAENIGRSSDRDGLDTELYSTLDLEELAVRLYHVNDERGSDSYMTTNEISSLTGVTATRIRELNAKTYGMGRAEKINLDVLQRKQLVRFAYLGGKGVKDIAKDFDISASTVYRHTKDLRDGTIAPDVEEVRTYNKNLVCLV
jgi:hypothetical protein